MSMTDDEKRLIYLKSTLTPKKMSSQEVRYTLQACVVTAIRRKFPNTDGALDGE